MCDKFTHILYPYVYPVHGCLFVRILSPPSSRLKIAYWVMFTFTLHALYRTLNKFYLLIMHCAPVLTAYELFNKLLSQYVIQT